MRHMNPDQFPTTALYPVIRDALLEMQENLQAPVALIAGAFGTVMSAACQGLVVFETPTGQERPASLFYATIADSGERKTACDSLVAAPLFEYDAALAEAAEAGIHAYEADMRCWKVKDKILQRKLQKAIEAEEDIDSIRSDLAAHCAARPVRCDRSRMIHQSITERPLMEALRGVGKSIVIMSSEGEIVLKGGATNKFGVVNQAWDCPKLISFGRADANYVARHPNMTLSFMVQEEVLADFMEKRGRLARGSGFLARFLVAQPSSTMGFRYMSLDEPIWEKLTVFHDRVRELLALRDQACRSTPVRLTFSEAAKELWVSEQNHIEAAMRERGALSDIRDFASKSLDNSSRLAAILHFFSGQAGTEISRETLDRAVAIGSWHLDEALRIFGGRQVAEDEEDAYKLCAYLNRKYYTRGRTVERRNVVRKDGPIRDQRRFEEALEFLINEGAIAVRYHDEVRKRGSLWIEMNPAFFNAKFL
jgi:hypothetical protein